MTRTRNMNVIKNIATKRIQLSHMKFSIISTLLIYIVCNLINIEKLTQWFRAGDTIDYSGFIAYFILGFCLFLFIFILFSHRWIIQPITTFLVIVSAGSTYFIAKYNIGIDRSMILNAVYTDATEVQSLLSVHMIPYVIFLIIIPVIAIWKVEIVFRKPLQHILRTLGVAILSLAVGMASLYIEFNSIHRAGNVSHKYILYSLVPVNYINSNLSLLVDAIQEYYRDNKKEIDISGSVSREQDLMVVLAIGESSRQKNFSLYGYDRNNTNPVLSQVGDLHLLNGIANKGSTIYALPEILEKGEVKLPTITSKLGIDTACYVHYTLYDNCSFVGEIEVDNCGHNDTCYDEDVLPLLEAKLQSYISGYSFVVLHLGGGSHGPTYSDKHPEEFQLFKPMCFDADVVNQCTEEELYNSYDNTIAYVDYVLGEAIDLLDESEVPYVFIYLSDHGESLLENGRLFHGMPPGVPLPPEQAEIPLIVKSSMPLSIVKRDEYLQQDVFDTVLDLLSIETQLFTKEKSFIKIDEGKSAVDY